MVSKVALLMDTSRGYSRALLHGIVRYGRLHGPWRFRVAWGDFGRCLAEVNQWGSTGIIARVESSHDADAVVTAGAPAVALDDSCALTDADSRGAMVGQIATNGAAVARLAADHLIERGFRQFAYVGELDCRCSADREIGFRKHLAEFGYGVVPYSPPPCAKNRRGPREKSNLAQWLCELPKPVALMACNDQRARDVLDACRANGLSVPNDVAVVGVDNDELLCELADPPLSSVALDAEEGGYRAAELLHRLMRGRTPRTSRLLIEPKSIVERRSTQASAIEHPEVAMALELIHHHAAETMGVRDIAKRLQISRRTLELKFREIIGRSPHHELQRVRFSRAQQLLLETNLPIPKVAAAAGFSGASYLAQVFRKRMGKSPSQYRRDYRHGPDREFVGNHSKH